MGLFKLNSLSKLGNASNEKRMQNIMYLKKLFNHQEVVTVKSAVKKMGYTEKTILSYAKEGNIPLLLEGKTVVPITADNIPKWMMNL